MNKEYSVLHFIYGNFIDRFKKQPLSQIFLRFIIQLEKNNKRITSGDKIKGNNVSEVIRAQKKEKINYRVQRIEECGWEIRVENTTIH